MEQEQFGTTEKAGCVCVCVRVFCARVRTKRLSGRNNAGCAQQPLREAQEVAARKGGAFAGLSLRLPAEE